MGFKLTGFLRLSIINRIYDLSMFSEFSETIVMPSRQELLAPLEPSEIAPVQELDPLYSIED